MLCLQEKFSQGLNQQKGGLSLHNKGSPWYQALLVHYTYVILGTRDHIYNMIYQRGQKPEANQSFHLYLLSTEVHHFKTGGKSGLLCSIIHIYAIVTLLSRIYCRCGCVVGQFCWGDMLQCTLPLLDMLLGVVEHNSHVPEA